MGAKAGFLPYLEEYDTICVHHTKVLNKSAHIDKCLFMPPIVASNFCRAGLSEAPQVQDDVITKVLDTSQVIFGCGVLILTCVVPLTIYIVNKAKWEGNKNYQSFNITISYITKS